MNLGVIGAMNGTFDDRDDDLLRTVILRRVFDNPVAKQGQSCINPSIRTSRRLAAKLHAVSGGSMPDFGA